MNQLAYKPQGYHSLTPYLTIRGAHQALDFYRKAFDAEILYQMELPNGKIGHAEIKIGDSHLMLVDEMPDKNDCRAPESLGGSAVGLMLYVPNVDEIIQQALAYGAKITKPVQDQFYGDRSGTLLDPFGHAWTIATHIEDVSGEELDRRVRQFRH